MFVALSALSMFAACGGAKGSAPLPTGRAANDAALLRGRAVFTANCSTCHGISGGGGVGPSFHNGRLQHDFRTVDDQIAFVRKGRGLMPAWGGRLSSSDLNAVVRYEREVLSTAGR